MFFCPIRRQSEDEDEDEDDDEDDDDDDNAAAAATRISNAPTKFLLFQMLPF